MVLPNLDRDVMMTFESVNSLPHIISENVYEPTENEMAYFLSGFVFGASIDRCDFTDEIVNNENGDGCYSLTSNALHYLMVA